MAALMDPAKVDTLLVLMLQGGDLRSRFVGKSLLVHSLDGILVKAFGIPLLLFLYSYSLCSYSLILIRFPFTLIHLFLFVFPLLLFPCSYSYSLCSYSIILIRIPFALILIIFPLCSVRFSS